MTAVWQTPRAWALPARGALRVGLVGPLVVAAACGKGHFVQVIAGPHFVCGLDRQGEVACWSGLSDTQDRDFGQADPPAGPFVRLAAGVWHACGLDSDGDVRCWGIDDGSSLDGGGTVEAAGPFTALSAGFTGTCAVGSSGRAQCWGYAAEYMEPVLGGEVAAVAVGALYECVLRPDGSVDCLDSMGNDDPITVHHDGPFASVSAGYDTTCALDATGRATCWPDEYDTENDTPYSQIAPDALGFLCALTLEGERECWGAQYDGSIVASKDGSQDGAPYSDLAMMDTDLPCMILKDGGIGCVAIGFDLDTSGDNPIPTPDNPMYPK